MKQIDSEHLIELARLVVDTANQEIDCAVFLDRAAAYLETRDRTGGPLPPALVAVEQHLKVCAECYEEFQALLAAARAS